MLPGHWAAPVFPLKAADLIKRGLKPGPGLGAVRPSGTHSESRPRPEQPADPRPALFRNIPPFGPA